MKMILMIHQRKKKEGDTNKGNKDKITPKKEETKGNEKSTQNRENLYKESQPDDGKLLEERKVSR